MNTIGNTYIGNDFKLEDGISEKLFIALHLKGNDGPKYSIYGLRVSNKTKLKELAKLKVGEIYDTYQRVL